jgi:Divergent InlB B-repeat domain
MRQSCAVGVPQIQASKLLVFLIALTFALAQEATAQSGRSLEGVTAGDLRSPNDPLIEVPGGAVPIGSYILEVVSGSGDGIYPTGRRVKVTADPPPAGQQFASWAGDIAILSNPFRPTTTAIIPSMDVSVVATYRDLERAPSSEPTPTLTPTPTPTPSPSPSPSPTPTPTPQNCPCIDDPADCFLEYSSSARGAALQIGAGAGFVQEFHKRYWVKLKSKTGKNTCDCHILQSATILKIYTNAGDAKRDKPGNFRKPAADPGFFSHVVNLPLIGRAVVSGDSNDYTEKNNKCINNEQTITDKPVYLMSRPAGTEKQIRFWTFTAQNWVKEVPSIKGTISMTASFKWTSPLSTEWSALSDPGNVNESGMLP